jgi:hypothetical protein
LSSSVVPVAPGAPALHSVTSPSPRIPRKSKPSDREAELSTWGTLKFWLVDTDICPASKSPAPTGRLKFRTVRELGA